MLRRNLVTSLLLYEQVRTTKKRAQVVAPLVDRLVAIAKSHNPHNAIRAINRVVTDVNASRKIMEVLIQRYAGRSSGLTRMVAVGSRKGDGALLVDLSLVDAELGKTDSAGAKEAKAKKPARAKNAKTTMKA